MGRPNPTPGTGRRRTRRRPRRPRSREETLVITAGTVPLLQSSRTAGLQPIVMVRSARGVHLRTGKRTLTDYQRTLTGMNGPIDSVFEAGCAHGSWTVPGQCMTSARPALDRV